MHLKTSSEAICPGGGGGGGGGVGWGWGGGGGDDFNQMG